MDYYLSKLIELGKLVGGRISFEQGFALFERLSKDELEALPEEERAYATHAMGRAVFRLGKDGKIINYKGVDSHLDNSEARLIDEVGALTFKYIKNDVDYIKANYPLNLVIFLGHGADIRIRGASPLEDLEIEADINSRMQGKGIKLPTIKEVKEFPEEMLKKFGLPIWVNGSFNEFDSESDDSGRKSYLKDIMGDNYQVQEVSGKRPETALEYFERIGVVDAPEVQEFLKKYQLTINDFSNYVDRVYSRGQRYGQAIREIESPFRIADLEILIGDNRNLPAIEAIVGFTESMHPDRVPFENYFAKQLGINLGNMMNNGWMCENFSHRQDYSITGEMCDDSYEYAPKKIEKLDEIKRTGEKALNTAKTDEEKKKAKTMIGKADAGKSFIKLRFFTQIYLLSSNIKVLQDEMRMRGKSQDEIDSVLTDFLDSFHKTLILEKALSKIADEPETARKVCKQLIATPSNIAKLLASQFGSESKINQEVLRTQTPFNSFFDEVSQGLAERFQIGRSFFIDRETKDDGANSFNLEI